MSKRNVASLIYEGQTITFEIIELTPALALEYEESNAQYQRPLRKGALRKLKGAVTKGLWRFNGEPIVFDENNHMMNGQHRCRMVIETGISILTLVIRGISSTAYQTYDQGILRKASDYMRDIPYKEEVETAARALYAYTIQGDEYNGRGLGHQDRPNNEELNSFMRTDTDLRMIADTFGKSWRIKSAVLPLSRCFFFYAIVPHNERPQAELFIGKLLHGTDLQAGDPILVFRNKWLVRDKPGTPQDQLRDLLKVYKVWKSGRKMKVLKHGKTEKFCFP